MRQDAGYTIPTSIGRCLTCHGIDTGTARRVTDRAHCSPRLTRSL